MIINIIAILLLAGKTLSSLPVHGLISMIDDDTKSINLHVNKSDVGGDVKFIEQLKAGKTKPRIYLDLREKIIEIIKKTEQNCFETNIGKVDDINAILQRATLLMQKHDKKIINQDLIYEDLQRFVIPPRYQNSMNLDQEFEYYIPSQVLFNIELEKERLNSRNELLFKYIKSLQDSLSWLTKLLDVKWQHLQNDLDDNFKWKLLNLQKQAKFLLENIIQEDQQQTEKRKNPEDNFSKKSKNNISNDKDTKIKSVTTLNEKNVKNFYKPNKTVIEERKNETLSINKNITDDKVETRIMNPQLNNISRDFKDKNSTARNIVNLNNRDFLTDKFKINLGNQAISKTNKFTRFPHNKSFAIGFEDRKDQFSDAKKVRAILLGKNITSTLRKKIEKQEQHRTRIVFHKISKKNVDKPLQNLVPLDKDKDKKQDIHHVSRKKIESESRKEVGARILMDEILEVVDEVLPTENPAEIERK